MSICATCGIVVRWHHAHVCTQSIPPQGRIDATLRERVESLELDRDEWKQACVDGNTRFQRSEAERRAMSDCEHGFPDGFGCALRCGEIRAEETDPDAVREPATCAGHPHREGGCGPQCAGCIDDARAEARRAALEECRSPAAVIPEAAPKMGSRGPCCSHHIPLDRDCDSCRVWAAGLAPAIERDALKARATAAEAENAALRERVAEQQIRLDASEAAVALLTVERDCLQRNFDYQCKEYDEGDANHRAMLDAEKEKLAVAIAALRSFALHWNAWRRPQDMAKAAQLVLDQLKKLEVE